MISITLYRPKDLDITISFPSEWDELTHDEVIFIAKTFLNGEGRKENEIRPTILKFLIESRYHPEPVEGCHPELVEGWFLYTDPEQIFLEVLPQLDFIFKTNNLTNTPPPIPGLGRSMDFEKITCGEYEDCEVFANKFLHSDDKEDLANLAAILFRPAPLLSRLRKSNGKDITPYMIYNHHKNSYHTYQAQRKVKRFLKLPPEQLYAIFIWYAGCRNQLPLRFPNVYDGGASSEPDMLAFTKCIHSGAGVKNGSREKIRVTQLYEYMFEMEQEAIKAKELEEEYARMSKT